MLQIDFDFDYIEQELRLHESTLVQAVESEQLGVPDIKDIVLKASLEIKQNAERRKKEQAESLIAGEENRDEFKNIKPKKMYLLSAPLQD